MFLNIFILSIVIALYLFNCFFLKVLFCHFYNFFVWYVLVSNSFAVYMQSILLSVICSVLWEVL